MPRLLKNKRFIIAVILLAAFAGNLAAHKERGRRRNYADFHCYYITGQRMLDRENIYVKGDSEVAEFRYAPIFAIGMSALARLSEDNANTIWYSLNFFLVILSFIFLKKLIIPGGIDFKSALIVYILAIAGLMRLILINLSTGQTNILMMACIILGLYFIENRREVVGAFILAFSITIKYTPLIFIPYFLVRGKFRAALWTIAAVLAYFIILPGILIEPQDNIWYLQRLIPFLTQSSILDWGTLLDPKNQSLLSAVQRLFTDCGAIWKDAPKMPFQTLKISKFALNAIPAGISILLFSSILFKPAKKHFEQAKNGYLNIDYALIFICLILYNLNSWPANYIFLTPGYFLIAWHLVKGKFKNKLLLVLLLVSYLLNIITQKAIFGQILAYKAYFYSPFTLSALVIFGALLGLKYSKKAIK